MKHKTDMPEESPIATKIFETMDNLFLEIRLNGNQIRLPQELRPETDRISAKQADKAVSESLIVISEQLRMLVNIFARLDPDHFYDRLKIFLEEWPERHPGENLLFFQTFKFVIEVRAEMILLMRAT